MEQFNPIIIAALIAQAVISKASHLAGALTGYLITTGILIWGLSVYSAGDFIALFGISLSQQAFLIACLVWYGFDTYDLLNCKAAATEESVKDSYDKEALQ